MSRKPRLGQVNPALSTLFSAPDVQGARRLRGGISELDAGQIEIDGRLSDRLDLDVDGLKNSIEQNGQRVPVLVRPLAGDRYRLIYGRRRLEACRLLGKPVRAIVAELDDEQALKDQLIENLERRDLSFIERALVASALLDGNQLESAERTNKSVAEILGLTEAGVSQLLSVVRAVGEDLIQVIGPAPGIGRPRWEELKKSISADPSDRSRLIEAALRAKRTALPSQQSSDDAFLAVLSESGKPTQVRIAPSANAPSLHIDGVGSAIIKTSSRGKRLKLDLQTTEPDFIKWIELNASTLINELHKRWKRKED